MGSDYAVIAALMQVAGLVGVALSVLLVVAVLRMWHHVAAMHKLLEQQVKSATIRPVTDRPQV